MSDPHPHALVAIDMKASTRPDPKPDPDLNLPWPSLASCVRQVWSVSDALHAEATEQDYEEALAHAHTIT